MDLDRLKLFVCIAETGSVSAASRKVHLTQPAASRNLRLLEESLGVELFARQGRGVALTAAGRALLPRARDILSAIEAARRDASLSADRGYFDLRLGTVDSIATYLLPHAIAPLRAAFPALALKLRTSRTGHLLESLERGDLDVAVIAHSDPPKIAWARAVGRYAMRYYGRKDLFGELARVSDESALIGFPIVEIEALPGQPSLISPSSGTGPTPRSFAVASSLASVKALVLGGFGVGALLDFMLDPAERAQLVHADVAHDPRCSVYVVASPAWLAAHGDAVPDALRTPLERALAPSAVSAPGGRSRSRDKRSRRRP